MASKDKSKKSNAAGSDRITVEDDRPLSARKRKFLLARLAGKVASSVVQTPSPSLGTADAVAEFSVSIAEAILQKTGL
jgi:hypothetical protein